MAGLLLRAAQPSTPPAARSPRTVGVAWQLNGRAAGARRGRLPLQVLLQQAAAPEGQREAGAVVPRVHVLPVQRLHPLVRRLHYAPELCLNLLNRRLCSSVADAGGGNGRCGVRPRWPGWAG